MCSKTYRASFALDQCLILFVQVHHFCACRATAFGLSMKSTLTVNTADMQELALLEYAVLNFPHSVVAAAAVLLAQSYDNLFTAAPHLQRLSGYTPQLLGCCMEELLDLQHRAFETNDLNSPFLAVKDKYRDCKWYCVSTITPHSHLPEQIYQSTGPAAAGKADRLKCQ